MDFFLQCQSRPVFSVVYYIFAAGFCGFPISSLAGNYVMEITDEYILYSIISFTVTRQISIGSDTPFSAAPSFPTSVAAYFPSQLL